LATGQLPRLESEERTALQTPQKAIMLPTTTLLLMLVCATYGVCRVWLHLARRRAKEFTAQPAWHEQWLGQRCESVTDPEDMDPSKVLAPLILRAMPKNSRTAPAWHEQWQKPTRAQAAADEEAEAIVPLVDDDDSLK
jgi:hypothetical protein